MVTTEQKTVADAMKYHEVMECLRNMQLPHGTCEPRERKACTHCNASDKLNRMIAEYAGLPVVLA